MTRPELPTSAEVRRRSQSLSAVSSGHRLICLGLRAEARNDLIRAAALYDRVALATDGETPPALVRAALRRGAGVALQRGEPSRAVAYLRRHLDLSADLPAQSRALAEHQLVDSLSLDGRDEEARSILRRSNTALDQLPQLDRLVRIRASIELGLDPDPRHLAVLAGAGDLPLESAFRALLTAAGDRAIDDASPVYDALAVVIRRASETEVSGLGGKGIVRCASQYERAGRFGDAAGCWKVIWLHRRERRGENDPKTLAAHGHFTRLSIKAGSAETVSRDRIWKRIRLSRQRLMHTRRLEE